jgi:hypothetical protein
MPVGSTVRHAAPSRGWVSVVAIVAILALLTPACSVGFDVAGSATPTPSVAPSPSGTPSPSATGSPSAHPAPAHCSEALSSLRLSFQAQKAVPGSDLADVERAAREARSYYRVRVPVCDPGKVAVHVLSRSKGAIAAQTHVSDVPDFRIDVFAHGPAWQRTPSAYRAIILLHEWYHVVEFSFLDCGPPECRGLRGRVPDWLVEGAAVYASLQAADDLHIIFYSLTRANQIRIAETDHEPLDRLTDISSPGSNYSVAFAAVELLVALGGHDALERFWRTAGATGGWKGAFERAFHLPLDAFYRRFASYRANGFRR